MKHNVLLALVVTFAFGVIGLTGCEWTGGSSDNSWNDSNSLANFNGTYQASSGYLVSEYTATSVTSTSSNGLSYAQATGESGGTASAGDKTTFSGQTVNGLIKPDTLTITFGNLGSFTDDGSGHLAGSIRRGEADSAVLTGTGTIKYDTGVWTITLEPDGLASSKAITVSYSYAVSSSGGSSSSSSGASGVSIFAFNVQQTGNSLKIVDNNGSLYTGSLGDVRTTGNLSSSSQGADFVNGDQVSASFSASGTSAAGKHVNMVGTFQGTAAGVSKVTTKSGNSVTYTTSMALENRTMTGTWVEDGGKTGNINGVCPSAANVTYSGNVSTNVTN